MTRATVVCRPVAVGLAVVMTVLAAHASLSQEPAGNVPAEPQRPIVCEKIPGATVCAQANADGRLPAIHLNPIRKEVVDLIEAASICMNEKPNLNCGRRNIDRLLTLPGLNDHEAALALNLDAHYWITAGDIEAAIWSLERILELPQDAISTGLSSSAKRRLGELYMAADLVAADAGASPDMQ